LEKVLITMSDYEATREERTRNHEIWCSPKIQQITHDLFKKFSFVTETYMRHVAPGDLRFFISVDSLERKEVDTLPKEIEGFPVVLGENIIVIGCSECSE
jgi:hypothetical protein